MLDSCCSRLVRERSLLAARRGHVLTAPLPAWVRENRLDLLKILLPGVSHDIRSRDHSILLAAELIEGVWRDLLPILDRVVEREGNFVAGGLEYSSLRDDLTDYIGQLIVDAHAIALLIAELRGLGRFDGVEERVLVDLNRVVESAAALATCHLRQTSSRLSCDLERDLPGIHTSPLLVTQALLNALLHMDSLGGDGEQAMLVGTRQDRRAKSVTCEISLRGRPAAGRPAPEWLTAAGSIVSLLGGTLETEATDDGTSVRLAFPPAG